MGIPLSVIIIFLGVICAMFSTVLTFLSPEEIEDSDELKESETEKLLTYRTTHENTINNFRIIELLFYFSGFSLIGFFLSLGNDSIYNLLYLIPLILFVYIIRITFISLGRKFSNYIAIKFRIIINIVYIITYPLSKLLTWLSLKILGKFVNEASREEISALIESSREDGAIDAGEYRILKSMMHFSSVLVSDVMTPRTVIFSLEADKKIGEVAHQPELKMYSRFPIWESDSLDSGVIGYVMSREIMNAALEGKKDMTLRDYSREVYFIPENAELDNALDQFVKRRQHLFVVVDEYGGVEGLLTMEDVVETILGVEIVDEADRVVDLREFAKLKRDKRVEKIIKGFGKT